MVQGDALRLSQIFQTKLNWQLQSQKHPLAMLLGAVGVGVVASRLLANLSGGQGWEQTLFSWARNNLSGSFWRQVLEMVWPHRNDDNEDEADATDASVDVEDAS